jgi:hypothetical protein
MVYTDKIGLKMYFIIDDSVLNDVNVVVTHGSKYHSFPAKDATLEDSETNLRSFSLYLPAKEIGDTVKVRIRDVSETDPSSDAGYWDYVTGKGKQIDALEGFSFSGEDYIRGMKQQNPGDVKYCALLDALANFSAAARKEFNYNADTAVVNEAAIAHVTAETLEPYEFTKVNSAQSIGMKKHQISTVLESETMVRNIFTLNDGDSIDNYIFLVEGVEKTPVERNGTYLIDFEKVVAKNLDEFYTVEVRRRDDSDAYYRVDYCVLSWCYQALTVSAATDNDRTLAKAMYVYNQAAIDYFGKTQSQQ